jgi:hypothetical protein
MLGSKVRAIYWTMICLRPHRFPHLYYSEKGDDLSTGSTHEMVDDMSDIVYQGLLTVVGRWEEIVEYFDELLAEKKGLLNPEYHDSLLNDDRTFSRSKKYFWAIEFLKEAEKSISDNIHQAERFVELIKSNPPETKTGERELRLRLRQHLTVLQKLDALKNRFKQKKDEAVALRDGVSHASWMIRGSTLKMTVALQRQCCDGRSGIYAIGGEYQTSYIR